MATKISFKLINVFIFHTRKDVGYCVDECVYFQFRENHYNYSRHTFVYRHMLNEVSRPLHTDINLDYAMDT